MTRRASPTKPHFALERIGPRRLPYTLLHVPFWRIDPMASSSSRPPTTAVMLDDDQDILRSATCPMCHASATLSQSALEAGGDWQCVRCGQHWDAARLAAVAAYAVWSVDHDRVGRQGAGDNHETALVGYVLTERLVGRP